MIDQPESLQDHAQHQRRLRHGELPADAGALSVAERLEGMARHPGFALGREVVGIEDFRLRSPDRLVAMEHRGQHGDEGALAQLVFPADRLVLVRIETEGWRGRPQPQRLLQDLADIDELVHLARGRLGVHVAPENTIDLLVGLLQHVRIVQQEVDGEGQHPARGLVTGDQEGVHLVADVDVVEPLAGLLVEPAQHEAQQVGLGGVVGRHLAALADDAVGDAVHEADIFLELLARLALGDVLERQAAHLHDGFERAHQRLDIGMVIAAIEGVETVVEAAQADRVEGERGHVPHHVDLLVGVQPLPLGHELVGDVEHALVVGLHHAVCEGRQQDVVRLLPVRLLGLGGEKGVAAQHAHPAQRPADRLVEPLLVAQFGDQVGARHDDKRRAHHVEPEDRPLLAGDPHQVLDRRPAVDGQHVAQQRRARRMRNWMQFVSRHEASFLPVVPSL